MVNGEYVKFPINFQFDSKLLSHSHENGIDNKKEI